MRVNSGVILGFISLYVGSLGFFALLLRLLSLTLPSTTSEGFSFRVVGVMCLAMPNPMFAIRYLAYAVLLTAGTWKLRKARVRVNLSGEMLARNLIVVILICAYILRIQEINESMVSFISQIIGAGNISLTLAFLPLGQRVGSCNQSSIWGIIIAAASWLLIITSTFKCTEDLNRKRILAES